MWYSFFLNLFIERYAEQGTETKAETEMERERKRKQKQKQKQKNGTITEAEGA